MLMKRWGKLPPLSHRSINAWIIYIGLPAIAFRYLPYIQWSRNMLIPAISPVVIWICAWVYIRMYAKLTALDRKTEGGLKLGAGLSNTSFVGFPLIIAYFGEEYLSIGVICDQVTYCLLSTAGIIVAIYSSKRDALSVKSLLRRLLVFPPFIATVLALSVCRLIDMDPLLPLLNSLGSIVAPLALFSIGLQLQFSGWKKEIRHIGTVLLYKLAIAPAIVLTLLVLLQAKGPVPQVTAFEAAMPSFVSSAIVAEQYDLNPRLLNQVIGVSILIGLVTTGVWYVVIRHFL